MLFFFYKSKDKKTTVIINDHHFFAVVSNNEITRTKGLSGKKELLEGEAMLFIFPETKKRTFWMKDMNFNLDIIFIRGHEIVDITTLKKPENNKVPSYTSKIPVDKVLEINAGLAREYDIKIGDSVEIK